MPGSDQIAHVDETSTDPPVEGRDDLGVAEVDLRLDQIRTGHLHLGRGRLEIRAVLVERLGRDRAGRDQWLVPGEFDPGEVERGFRGRELTLGFEDLRLVRRLFDHEHRVAGGHRRALLETTLLEEAGDPGLERRLPDRFGVPGVSPEVRNVHLLRRHGGDREIRLLRRRLRGRTVTSGQRGGDTERDHGEERASGSSIRAFVHPASSTITVVARASIVFSSMFQDPPSAL